MARSHTRIGITTPVTSVVAVTKNVFLERYTGGDMVYRSASGSNVSFNRDRFVRLGLIFGKTLDTIIVSLKTE